jgi:SAM-dependent methyltransferase
MARTQQAKRPRPAAIPFLYPRIKRIRMAGHRHTRTISCPYCRRVIKVTLVNHLRREHPSEWHAWTGEFVRLYNETNDLKRVMRAFTNSDGQPILSWTVIDNEVKRRVAAADLKPRFLGKETVSAWQPSPIEYSRFTTTVWDVPRRGTWGVHQSTYRGNWAPQIPRALIETYSKPGDHVLDPFVGGGTTLLECWALGRHAVGYDVSEFALEMTRARLHELKVKAERESMHGLPPVRVEVRKGDARKLRGLRPESVDFICTHPPYGDALRYSHDEPADLSRITNPPEFLEQLTVAGKRFFHVLRPGSYCAILIGDLRREGTLYTLGVETLHRFKSLGFVLEEIIIKTQNQDRSTEFFFKGSPVRFRIAHEFLLVFRKPNTPTP